MDCLSVSKRLRVMLDDLEAQLKQISISFRTNETQNNSSGAFSPLI